MMNNNLMNQLGIDNILNNNAINPLHMNNMMGMNIYQPNLMDTNALKIKNIIEHYENKIKVLEEIIRQMDFEITLLKYKLKSNENNIQNQLNPMMVDINNMNMNMNNDIMMMIENNNNNFINKGQKISIFFDNNKYDCFENELTYKIFEKFPNVIDWHLIKFKAEEKNYILFLL